MMCSAPSACSDWPPAPPRLRKAWQGASDESGRLRALNRQVKLFRLAKGYRLLRPWLSSSNRRGHERAGTLAFGAREVTTWSVLKAAPNGINGALTGLSVFEYTRLLQPLEHKGPHPFDQGRPSDVSLCSNNRSQQRGQADTMGFARVCPKLAGGAAERHSASACAIHEVSPLLRNSRRSSELARRRHDHREWLNGEAIDCCSISSRYS